MRYALGALAGIGLTVLGGLWYPPDTEQARFSVVLLAPQEPPAKGLVEVDLVSPADDVVLRVGKSWTRDFARIAGCPNGVRVTITTERLGK